MGDSETAVRFNQVSKRYLLGSRRAYLRYLLPGPLGRALGRGPGVQEGQRGGQEIWALNQVSFEVRQGEVLGLIGPNGAGKTTALSLLAGITSPTECAILLRGRVGALIKLGAGFHPDLTGRENVYLNGSILGLKRAEIDHLYDDIVEFAELGGFMDTPVKRYSSGMYVRLGFSVAVHIDPEILLVDEVLSVGDVSFQSKCLNRIGKIRDSGSTVVFVSHNMHHVAGFCDRVVYLDHGRVKREGNPSDVLEAYISDVMAHRIQETDEDGLDFGVVNGSGRMVIERVYFTDRQGNEVEKIRSGEGVFLHIDYRSEGGIVDPVLDVVIRDASRGNMFQATNRDFGVELGDMGNGGRISVFFHSLPSNNQVLDFFVSLWNASHTEKLDWKRYVKLQVPGNPASSGRFLFDCEWTKAVGTPAALPLSRDGD